VVTLVNEIIVINEIIIINETIEIKIINEILPREGEEKGAGAGVGVGVEGAEGVQSEGVGASGG
jgi:hypothetical protein